MAFPFYDRSPTLSFPHHVTRHKSHVTFQMIAPKDSIEPHAFDAPLPNSRKVYVPGSLHPDIRVPFREISLAPTKTISGQIEVNEPVRVYDTSGPWSDPDFHGDVEQGLPPLRADWIRVRNDVEEIVGRAVTPIDDGYLSEKHAAIAAERPTSNVQRPTSNGNGSNGSTSSFVIRHSSFAARKPLRAKSHPVTQLWYARRGIVTPEMEFIAIRENLGRTTLKPETRILN